MNNPAKHNHVYCKNNCFNKNCHKQLSDSTVNVTATELR
jgi:hypothetical protein